MHRGDAVISLVLLVLWDLQLLSSEKIMVALVFDVSLAMCSDKVEIEWH